jgi:leucyl aminopeptidase (aminopeptidase T)
LYYCRKKCTKKIKARKKEDEGKENKKDFAMTADRGAEKKRCGTQRSHTKSLKETVEDVVGRDIKWWTVMLRLKSMARRLRTPGLHSEQQKPKGR